ncbi:MAG: N-acetylmuramoyl-L-alanine amidase [Aeromicrobium sp.]|nr:N-acetylmuramoyl-L-alanine amidase [Burkholderiales bacterium]
MLLSSAAALPLLGSQLLGAASAPSKVSAARVWPADEYTRVTFEAPAGFKYQHFFVKDPERLVLDIENVELGDALKSLAAKVGADDPYIKSVRVGINRPNVVRVVLDLRTEVLPQVFAVPPVGEFGHRLMLDIYPAKPVDSMLALLNADTAMFAASDKDSSKANAPIPSDGKPGDKPAVAGSLKEPSKEPSKDSSKDAIKGPSKDLGKDAARDAGKDTPKAPEAPAIIAGRKPPRPFTVVVDPGHGGEDPGAVGKAGTREKDIVLTISRLLKDKLDHDARFRIALTRDADYFVPLHHRVQRARRMRADLFISVHADAFIHPQANGSSVFALSERGATSTAAKWIANKENDADLIGGINLSTRDSSLARILLDLSTTAQINDSLKLGRYVLSELGEVNRLHKPQVEQAGFAVLKAPDIPSILIETAFISNPEEERKLRDASYQAKMADAIADGVRTYFKKNPALARV